MNITQLNENIAWKIDIALNNGIDLLTQWYFEKNSRRRIELVYVLHLNVINIAIDKIHFIQNSKNCTIWEDVLIDPFFPQELFKLKLIISYQNNIDPDQRLTFSQAFQYANNLKTTGYKIITNLDIFFDRSLLLLKHRPLINPYVLLYLSRYEIDPSISTIGLQCSDEHYIGSHDALIFRTILPQQLIDELEFEIGTWHLEMKIIHELTKINLTVRNSCKSIRVWHLHSSQVRHRLMPEANFFPEEMYHIVRRRPEYL